jgi:hypothetical protein
MRKEQQHGFGLIVTRRRLEDWWLEHFACPAGEGVPVWPGGRSDSIRALLLAHWGTQRCDARSGAPQELRHFDLPRAALGVALALLEMDGYEVGCAELDDLAWLRQAQNVRSISTSMRDELLALADQIAASPISRAVMNRTGGRPKRMLAQAVAQHLRDGGFTQRKIADFMNSSVKVVAGRCKVEGARSLAVAP